MNKKNILILFSFFFLINFNFLLASDCQFEFTKTQLCNEIIFNDDNIIIPNQKNKMLIKHQIDLKQFRYDVYSYMIMENGHHHRGPKFNTSLLSDMSLLTTELRIFNGGMSGRWEIRFDLYDLVSNELIDQAIYSIKF